MPFSPGQNHSEYRHGHCLNGKSSPTYMTWYQMFWRCKDREPRRARTYKDRGISVCERWQDFNNFLADMGQRPAGKTLDRIDPDKGYSPDNCRWATSAEQQANRRDTAHPHRVLKLVALAEHYSIRQLTNMFKEFGYGSVHAILTGRRWSSLTGIQREVA